MITRERIEAVLDRVRPFMRANGGDIELIEVNGNSADIRLTGMCAGCPSAHITLYLGVEMALRDEIPSSTRSGCCEDDHDRHRDRQGRGCHRPQRPHARGVRVPARDRLRELESNLITWALKVTDGNKSRAANCCRSSVQRSATASSGAVSAGRRPNRRQRHDRAEEHPGADRFR
jgi:Fe-S cluster biogenesis protein NfuA